MPAVLRGRNLAETLNIALVGVGGRGGDNHKAVSGQNIVALCDVDENHLGEAARRSPRARTYHDFRKMFDELHGQIDAVIVSTPDHTHAVISNAALELGKHVYCEKPLTHSIHEARVLAAAAARHKLATQMGNAGHSSEGTRRVVEADPGRCHRARPRGPRVDQPANLAPGHRPARRPSAGSFITALGPLARPGAGAALSSGLPPFQVARLVGFWHRRPGRHGVPHHRRRLLGLDLREPRSIEAESPPISPHPETAPAWSIVRYDFQARGSRPAVKLFWYDGGKLPPLELFDGHAPGKDSNGSLFVGEKGRMLVGGQRGRGYRLLPEREFAGYVEPKPTLARSPGHHAEWIEACKTGKPTGTNFEYSSQLTELVLLGNVALRAGRRIEWDAAGLKITNGSLDDPFIHREYRPGWAL